MVDWPHLRNKIGKFKHFAFFHYLCTIKSIYIIRVNERYDNLLGLDKVAERNSMKKNPRTTKFLFGDALLYPLLWPGSSESVLLADRMY